MEKIREYRGNQGKKIKRVHSIYVKMSLSLLFVLIITACERYNKEFEPLLNVYCVLKNNIPYQQVVVDRTYGMEEKSIYDLEDVQVILSGNGVCDTLSQDSLYGELGLFITRDSFPVIPGETYFLRVSAKGFDTLRGMTTIPDSFQLIYPDNGDTISVFDTIAIKFEKSNQWVWFSVYYQESLLVYTTVGDSINNLPVSLFALDSGFYQIKISTADTNFVNYFYMRFDSLPQCGVENGIGLFGSMYIKKIDFYVRFERR